MCDTPPGNNFPQAAVDNGQFQHSHIAPDVTAQLSNFCPSINNSCQRIRIPFVKKHCRARRIHGGWDERFNSISKFFIDAPAFAAKILLRFGETILIKNG
jgi:hypothetical protein